MVEESKGTSKMGCLKIGGIILAVIIVLIIIGAMVGDPESQQTTVATSSSEGEAPAQEVPVEDSKAGKLTGPQKNALRSAQSYLSMSGFSRKGLINQLSSPAGDGYDVDDATAAVDSMPVDWNEQAARSAKQYLSMSGFSCKGLIQQLSSSAGDNYTTVEATYGANQAGAC